MQLKTVMFGLAATVGLAVAQDAFSVATPQSLQQCVPYQILITGGTPPFNIRVTQPGDISSIIENLPQTSDRTVTWLCNIASGQMITLNVIDSTGASAASSQSNSINPNSNSSCLGTSASIVGGSGSASTSAGSGSSSTAAGSSSSRTSSAAGSTSTGSSNTGSTGSTGSTSASGSTTTSSGNTNGATTLAGASAAVAGLVGAAVAILL